jgi:hypothetical protein
MRALLVFSACFTDERAFVAAGLLLAHFLFFAQDQNAGTKLECRQPFWPCWAAWPATASGGSC